MIGFGGHRDFGMQCLALGASWPVQDICASDARKDKVAVNFFQSGLMVEKEPGTRRFLCDMMLSSYHIIMSTMIQLPGCNFPLATKMVAASISIHPDSFLYLIFQGKISQAERNIEKSIDELKKVVQVQKDWRQLAHVCFWDIGICYAAIAKWADAASYFDILYKENKWSKSIYLYLKACMLYTDDPKKNQKEVSEMMKQVPKYLKKVAGKSIPLEVSLNNVEICG